MATNFSRKASRNMKLEKPAPRRQKRTSNSDANIENLTSTYPENTNVAKLPNCSNDEPTNFDQADSRLNTTNYPKYEDNTTTPRTQRILAQLEDLIEKFKQETFPKSPSHDVERTAKIRKSKKTDNTKQEETTKTTTSDDKKTDDGCESVDRKQRRTEAIRRKDEKENHRTIQTLYRRESNDRKSTRSNARNTENKEENRTKRTENRHKSRDPTRPDRHEENKDKCLTKQTCNRPESNDWKPTRIDRRTDEMCRFNGRKTAKTDRNEDEKNSRIKKQTGYMHETYERETKRTNRHEEKKFGNYSSKSLIIPSRELRSDVFVTDNWNKSTDRHIRSGFVENSPKTTAGNERLRSVVGKVIHRHPRCRRD